MGKEIATGRKLALGTVMMVVAAAALATSVAASPQAACSVCGKNLIKNPGAESGAGITAVGAYGAVPGWTITGGQFGAASYTFANGWFSARSKGSPKRGKNYFFGGTSQAAITSPASVGTQTIKLPAAAAGKKVTLGAWLGNYPNNFSKVRAEFADAGGTVLAKLSIGLDTTIAGTDMTFRSRKGTVPRGAAQVSVVVTFGNPKMNQYNLAGADDLSLVLA